MIEQADTLVRLITIGASLMLLALLVEGEMRKGLKATLVGLLVSVIGYMIMSSTALRPPGNAAWPLVIVAMSVPFWSWIFARRLFEREPPTRIVWAIVALLVTCWLAGRVFESLWQIIYYVHRAISLGLIVDLVRVGLAGRDDDLIEKRRVIRLVLPLLIAAQTTLVLIYEMAVGPAVQVAGFQLVNAVLILLITLFAGMALMVTDRELLIESERDTDPKPPERIDLSPSESVLHDKLTAAMADGAYRIPGLTITGLAELLDTPEHRLRALINRRLGHRNFSAFLNRHRIAEARERLAAREHVDLPILTIAMDLGYNSLATFNRAFRSEAGTTPSEYRREALGLTGDQNAAVQN